MEKLANISKRVLTILAISAAIILVGWAGQLDHDEYIEANSVPVTQMP